jgi:hypothetical protein
LARPIRQQARKRNVPFPRPNPLLHTLLRSGCLLAVVLFGVCGQAEDAGEIVPIRFADLDAPESAPVEVLMIPSVIVEDELVPNESFAPAEPALAAEPTPLEEVSSRAADGLRIQDFGVEEMPYEASSGEWFSNGNWYGSAEVLWFDRSRNYRRVLGNDVTFQPGRKNPVGSLTTTGVPFDLSPGARVTFGKYIGRDYLDRDQSLEMSYYGGLSYSLQDSWNALPDSFLVTPLARQVPGFNGAQRYGTTHNSNFNSMEWNYKLHRRLGRDQLVMSPNGNWTRHAERAWLPALIIGTRVASVNEGFTFSSRRNDVSASDFSGDYGVNTQNWLWGLSLGGELLSQNEFYFWGLRGRATPSMSFAANQQLVQSVNTLSTIPNPSPPPATIPLQTGSVNRASSAEQFGPGFVGDLSLFAGWNVTPNFSVKAGWDFLWVAGVATTNRQFDFAGVRVDPIDAGGQIFYNGLSLGCEGSW